MAGKSMKMSGGKRRGKNGVLSADGGGLKMGPATVLGMSLAYIGVVLLLHIWSKFRKG